MNKAIEVLEKEKTKTQNALLVLEGMGFLGDDKQPMKEMMVANLKDLDQALAELEQTQAKLDSLREYCSEQVETMSSNNYMMLCGGSNDEARAYQDILTKLDEGKEQ